MLPGDEQPEGFPGVGYSSVSEDQGPGPQGNFLDALASFFGFGEGTGTGTGDTTGQDEATDGDADVGFINSILMGLGLKDKTDDYYRATLDSINRSQGPAAADRYRQHIMGQGVLSVPGALSNYDIATMAITGQPPIPQVTQIRTPTIAPPQAPMTPMPQTMQAPMQQGVGSLMQPPGAIRPLV